MASDATLYVEPGAILESGVWCGDCFTSAIVRVEILALGVDGFRRIAVARWCDHCKQLKKDPL